MAEIDPRDFDRLIETLKGTTESLHRMTNMTDQGRDKLFSDFQKSTGAQRNSSNRSERMLNISRTDFINGMDRTSEKFKLLGRGADDLFSSLTSFASNSLLFSLPVQLASYFNNLTKTYRDLAESGQSFSGGLMGMSRAAAQAGLTLEQFSNFMRNNSVLAASLGGDSLVQITKAVRKNSEQFGMFGYSMEGLDEATAAYAETLRLTTKIGDLSKDQIAESATEFAKTTSLMSLATGKDRREIMRVAKEAMSDASFMAKKMQLSADQILKFDKSLGAAITGLAAQPGQAGTVLSSMLAQAEGAGSAVFSDAGRMFNEAGLGSVIGMIDDLRERVKQGQAPLDANIDFLERFRQLGARSMESLQILAITNDSAREAIKIFGEVSKYTKEELAEHVKNRDQRDKLTKNMLNFENVWGRVSGTIRDKFLSVLERVMDSFVKGIEALGANGTFDKIGDGLTSMGRWFSGVLETAFNPQNLQILQDTVTGIGTYLGKFADWVKSFFTNGTDRAGPSLEVFNANVISTKDAIVEWSKIIGYSIAAIIAFKTALEIAAGAAAIKGVMGGVGSSVGGAAAAGAAGAVGGGLATGAKIAGATAGAVVTVGQYGWDKYKEWDTIDKSSTMSKDEKDRKKNINYTEAAGGIAGGIGGVLAGAKLGAMGGSFLGPLGTLIGAGIGASIGGFLGSGLGDSIGTVIGNKFNPAPIPVVAPKQTDSDIARLKEIDGLETEIKKNNMDLTAKIQAENKRNDLLEKLLVSSEKNGERQAELLALIGQGQFANNDALRSLVTKQNDPNNK